VRSNLLSASEKLGIKTPIAGTSSITVTLSRREKSKWSSRQEVDKFNVATKLASILRSENIDIDSESTKICSFKRGININGRGWKVGFYAEFLKTDQTRHFGHVVSFYFVSASPFERAYVLLEQHEFVGMSPLICVSANSGGAQVLVPCTSLQFLMKDVVNDEDNSQLFLIRVSSTVDYGQTLEV
jgi:hypothetical protein